MPPIDFPEDTLYTEGTLDKYGKDQLNLEGNDAEDDLSEQPT